MEYNQYREYDDHHDNLPPKTTSLPLVIYQYNLHNGQTLEIPVYRLKNENVLDVPICMN